MRADPAPSARDAPEIVDNLPDLVPVTQSELDVIETYLGSLLDDLLKRGPQGQNTLAPTPITATMTPASAGATDEI